MVKYTPGFVGADIQTLCKEASIISVERAIREMEADESSESSEENDAKPNQLEKFFIEVEDF